MAGWKGLLNKTFGNADSRTTPEILGRVVGNTSSGMSPYSGTMETESALAWYERLGVVFRCVDLIATTQTSIPIVLRNNFGLGKIVENTHLYRLLNVRPNDYEDAFTFRYRVSALALLDRRGVLIEVQRSAAGIPVALHVMPAGSWQPVRELNRNGKPERFVDYFRVNTMAGSTNLKPENVLWLKNKPHPSDPYLQMTPLMASKLSIETDYYARVFNRNFLMNDGRPGLLVAVKGQISPEDAQELQDRFSRGVSSAGKATVIETDTGIDVQDMAGNPRDIQWDSAVSGSEKDIMAMFGVPESVYGDASQRTFNNADAEWGNFWDLTMRQHCDAISTGLEPLSMDSHDDVVFKHNYDLVPVLQIAKNEDEARSLQRVKDGVITMNQHYEVIGREKIDQPWANVHFLWNNIIAADMETAKKVGALPVVAVPDPEAILKMQMNAQLEMQRAQMQGITGGQGGMQDSAGGTETTVTQLNRGYEQGDEQVDGELYEPPSMKSLGDRVENFFPKEEDACSYEREAKEAGIEGMLEQWSHRQAEVIASRLDHEKFRRGTRYWTGETKGEVKAISSSYPVEATRWVDEIVETTTWKIDGWVVEEARKATNRIRRNKRKLTALGVTEDQYREMLSQATPDYVRNRVRILVRNKVEVAAAAELAKLSELIEKMADEDAELEDIKDAVKQAVAGRTKWHQRLATELVTLGMEAAITEAYRPFGAFVRKWWHTRNDDKVRHTHKALEGKGVPEGQMFTQAGIPIEFPGDPNAPIGMTINCRCWLSRTIGN